MAVAVCVLTNVFFVALFVAPIENQQFGLVQRFLSFTFVTMVLLFIALRWALRAITSPKSSELDEMQRELRDNAYQLGYLVVRRVGLGITIALVVVMPVLQELMHLGSSSITQNGIKVTNHEFLQSTEGIREFLKQYLVTDNLLQLFFGLVLVMTFAAYCFPLVILAWRYARILAGMPRSERGAFVAIQQHEVPYTDNAEVASEVIAPAAVSDIASNVKRFRLQLAIVLVVWLFELMLGYLTVFYGRVLGFDPFWSLGCVVAWFAMPFTLWVLFAGMFKQRILIRRLRWLSAQGAVSLSAFIVVYVLAILTGVFSAMIPITVFVFMPIRLFGVGNWWAFVFATAFATLISQTASFIFAGRAARVANARVGSASAGV
jgi:hypothetical protein